MTAIAKTPLDRALASSQVYRLCAALFGHPNRDGYEALASGRLQSALAASWSAVTGRAFAASPATGGFEIFESGYIAIFGYGPKGKPEVALLAGEYEDLLNGELRPNFMLNIGQFYRHFGLKAGGRDGPRDEPDHIATMLEFLAWLGFLQARALERNRPADGAMRAERDFLQRYVVPLLVRMHRHAARVRAWDSLDPTLRQVVQELPAFAGHRASALEAMVGPFRSAASPAPDPATAPVGGEPVATTQNLWG